MPAVAKQEQSVHHTGMGLHAAANMTGVRNTRPALAAAHSEGRRKGPTGSGEPHSPAAAGPAALLLL